MRNVAKIALGTALGIVLAGVPVVVGLVVLGYSLDHEAQSSQAASEVAAARTAPDADGDTQPDAEDPEPYSANSDAHTGSRKTERHSPSYKRAPRQIGRAHV